MGSSRMKTRTYVDACVLISGFCHQRVDALELLDDESRQLVVSDFVKLEVLPKPTVEKKTDEVEFMVQVLSRAENAPCSAEIVAKAIELACTYNLKPLDALHIAAACAARVDEFVTMEKPNSPLLRVREIKVTTLNTK